MNDKQEKALRDQYKVVSDFQAGLDDCFESIKNHDQARLIDQLSGLRDLMKNSTALFKGHRIFSALPGEFIHMTREVNDAVKLLENQKQLSVNDRTP